MCIYIYPERINVSCRLTAEMTSVKYLQCILASPAPWLLVALQGCFLYVLTLAVVASVFLQTPVGQLHH